MSLTAQLYASIQSKQHQKMYRKRQVHQENVLSFSDNDYLSLSSDLQVKKAYQSGIALHPVGSGGSMVVSGYHPVHKAVERDFAEALGVDDCILFSSGYAANLSIMALLSEQNVHVLMDRGVHASFYDGIKLSALNYTRYRLHDFDDFVAKIQRDKIADHPNVVLTESIFSMSGYMPPLAEMAKYTEAMRAEMIVDEAHAFGILGQEGLGATHAAKLTQDVVPLRVIPLGKACAALGAIVAGKGVWIEALLQTARAYIYSTGISPAAAYGLQATLSIIRAADDRRMVLKDRIEYFRSAIKKTSLKWRDSQTQIQQLQLGCPQKALKYAEQLKKHNIFCIPMRKPTVNLADTGLRIILNYKHTEENIDYLLNCLEMVSSASELSMAAC